MITFTVVFKNIPSYLVLEEYLDRSLPAIFLANTSITLFEMPEIRKQTETVHLFIFVTLSGIIELQGCHAYIRSSSIYQHIRTDIQPGQLKTIPYCNSAWRFPSQRHIIMRRNARAVKRKSVEPVFCWVSRNPSKPFTAACISPSSFSSTGWSIPSGRAD